MIEIYKKDGRLESYEPQKIINAVQKSAERTNQLLTDQEQETLLLKIQNELLTKNVKIIPVQDMHELVQKHLKEVRPDVFEEYYRYRNYKIEQNDLLKNLYDDVNDMKYYGYRENANKDSQLISTRGALMTEKLGKQLMLNYELKPEWREAHERGWLYIHDLGDRIKDTFNCCVFDMKNVLRHKPEKGYAFKLNKMTYQEPKTIRTAFSLVGDLILSASSNQYGGFSCGTIDDTLAPYAERTYHDQLAYFVRQGIDHHKAKDLAYNETMNQIKQGYQSLEYKLNSLSNALGQTPFVSISFGIDTSFWGREITKTILKTRRETDNVVFPKLIFFVHEGLNQKPNTPNYDLYKEALKTSSTRLYPDYVSLNSGHLGDSFRRTGVPNTPMGCVDYSETITWKNIESNITITEPIGDFYSRFQSTQKYQPDSVNFIIDLPEHIYIKDSHNINNDEFFVRCKNIIKNLNQTNWLKIHIQNHEPILLTTTHPLPVYQKGRIFASELKIGDQLYTAQNQLIAITAIEELTITQDSYDVTTESDYFDVSGLISYNCRSFPSDNFFHPETGEEIYTGRANVSVVTLNLTKYALESDGDLNKFEELIQQYTSMAMDINEWYHAKVSNLKGSSNPLFWCEGGAWMSVGYDESVAPIVKGFNASCGYHGMNQAVNALNRKRPEDQQLDPHGFNLNVLNNIREQLNVRKEKTGILHSLYGTPCESLTYTWSKLLKEQYGVIENVTDREYLTNSFHVDVWEHISIPEKIDYEAPFHQISTGGKISYIEAPYGTSLTSLEKIVNYAMDKGMYFGVNIINGHCNDCDERGDFLNECPSCGSKNTTAIYRVCGYIGVLSQDGDFKQNPGKVSEAFERVDHSGYNIKTRKSYAESTGIHTIDEKPTDSFLT